MGGTTVDFSYFFGGLRKTKTSGGVTKNYYYDGDRLIAEKWSTGAYLLYHYDETGSPYAITYSATGGGYAKYYFIKNLQGDVLQIRNVNNTVVANYEYDAWGRVVSVKYANGNDINVSNHIGVINPIRYRGYYYDSETGFYYLKSRYYDPAIGRFISADSFILVGGSSSSLNLFAYCGNNPVNRVDYGGNFFAELWDFAQAAASEIGKAIGVMSPAYAGCGGVAVADGPLPFGDIAAISGAALITVGAIGYGIYQAATAPAAIAVPEIKLEVKEKDGVLPGKPLTTIYRKGGSNPGNLTPREKDLLDTRGLSFSTFPYPICVKTTIEELNATGLVYAVQDGATHISVYPVGGSMQDWVEAGANSAWTQAVKSVVSKY